MKKKELNYFSLKERALLFFRNCVKSRIWTYGFKKPWIAFLHVAFYVLVRLKKLILQSPLLTVMILNILNYFPKIKYWLRGKFYQINAKQRPFFLLEIAHKMLVYLKKNMLRYPCLEKTVVFFFLFFPKTKEKLEEVHHLKAISPTVACQAETRRFSLDELSSLTPCAKEIYKELRIIIQKNKDNH